MNSLKLQEEALHLGLGERAAIAFVHEQLDAERWVPFRALRYGETWTLRYQTGLREFYQLVD